VIVETIWRSVEEAVELWGGLAQYLLHHDQHAYLGAYLVQCGICRSKSGWYGFRM